MRRALFALLLLLAAPIAGFGQTPPAVPALPDTERRTAYSISGTTCNCAVNFAIYGDGTDVDAWIQVWFNGVRRLSTDPVFGWTLSSPSGLLSSIPRPITDAVLTFNAVHTGTVQIVGARRPRALSQFPENRGVAARDLNQRLTDLTAIERELWDKTNDITGRGLFTQPGNVMAPLPTPSFCINQVLSFGPDGLTPTCIPPGSGSGGGVGSVTSVSAGCGSTTFGPPITSTGTISAVEGVNRQVGTSYAIGNGDCGSLTIFSNAVAVAVTLGQAATGGNFVAGWYNDVCNQGAGTVTVTPTISTINGASTLVLSTTACARIISDGVNYAVVRYGGGLAPATIYSAAGTPLPACATASKAWQAVVSDATAPTYNATYTSGGAVVAAVVCDGTNWKTQ